MGFTCKMCGSDLFPEKGAKVVTCEMCGTEQTLPKEEDAKKVEAYNKANELRREKRFDEAIKKYEKIIEKYPEDGEAYWCLLLCQYGIEYVDDKKTQRKIPTCNRTLKTSIFNTKEYKKACSLATKEEKDLYETEAKEIDRLQKRILSVSKKEAPYDIFICFKDTDDDGERTKDSQHASKIYEKLMERGYRVFFSRVTLKDKVGDYEPYIYAALQSAKVMILVGTKKKYVKAVWVKNEWSRYLGFIDEDGDKVIVPCIKDMEIDDLPDELQDFQVYNMQEMDFMESLTRAIDSKFGRAHYAASTVSAQPAYAPNTQPTYNYESLLKRITMFLEDKDWEKAEEYCENILDQDPEHAEAYMYKAMAQLYYSDISDVEANWEEFRKNKDGRKAIRYATGDMKEDFDNFEVEYLEEKRIEDEKKRKAAEKERERKEKERKIREEKERQEAIKRAEEIRNKERYFAQYPLARQKIELGKELDKLAKEPRKYFPKFIIPLVPWLVFMVVILSIAIPDAELILNMNNNNYNSSSNMWTLAWCISGAMFTGVPTFVMMVCNLRTMKRVRKNRRNYEQVKNEYDKLKQIPDYNPSIKYDGKTQEKEEKKADNAVTAPPQTAETEKERVMAARRAQNVCQYCGSPFDNTPDKKCTKCGWKKDY